MSKIWAKSIFPLVPPKVDIGRYLWEVALKYITRQVEFQLRTASDKKQTTPTIRVQEYEILAMILPFV